MANASEIKNALLAQLDSTVQTLYPQAVLKASNWEVGGINGEKGHSLRISANGVKRGVWSDFASGDAGDILDLWIHAKGFSNYREAAPALHEYLGLKMHEESKPHKTYKTPANEFKSSQRAINYLKGRSIPDKLIEDFQIAGSSRDDAVAFRYFDENGKLTMIKYLSYQRENGKKNVWVSPESKPILYGMHTHLVRSSHGILGITEGEIDCQSWQAQGFPFVSVPFGAKTDANQEWVDNCYEWLEQFHTIYISMDMDTAGHEAAAWLMKTLGHERTYLVSLPHKDANECLKHGVDLKDCITKAKIIDPAGIRLASSMSKEVWTSMHQGRREDHGIVPFDWDPDDFPFRMRTSEGTVITGYPGDGKSSWCYQLMAWLASAKRERCFIGSYEEKAKEILTVMSAQCLGKWPSSNEYSLFKEVETQLLENIIIHDFVGTVKYEDFFSHAEYACRRYGVRWVLLDSATRTDVNLEEDKEVKKFCERCCEFWDRTGAHLIVIAHARKPPNERFIRVPTYHDIKGANYWGTSFFNAFTIYRGENSALIKCSKNRVGGKLFERNLHFDEDSKRMSLHPNDNKSYI